MADPNSHQSWVKVNMAPGNPACLHFPESARTPSPRTFMSYNSFPDQGVYRKMYSELRRRDLDEHREYGPVHVFENQELVNPRERAAADHAEQQEPVVGPNTAAEEQVDPNTPRVHDIENGDGVTRDAKITVIDLSSESNDSGSPTRLSEAEADATTSAEKEPPKTPEHRIIRSMASPPAGARRRLSYSSDRKTDDYSSSTNCSNCNHQLKKLGKRVVTNTPRIPRSKTPTIWTSLRKIQVRPPAQHESLSIGCH